MRPKLRTMTRLLYVWMSWWVLVVPLFHVHPDADPQHGSWDHRHGGTVHTVFSSDLEWGFEGSHAVGGTTGTSAALIELAHRSGHRSDHLEVAIVLGSSPKPFDDDGPLFDDAVLSSRQDRSSPVQSTWWTWPPPVRTGLTPATVSSPRAPPIV